MLGLVGPPSILIQTGAESWGRFPVPRIYGWESRVDTKCPEIKEMCKIRFYNQLPPSDTITNGPCLQKWASSKTVWNPDTGEDTKCLAMEPMCQIMFYNQLPTSDTIHKWTLPPEVGRFHIGALTDVEPGHWSGHQVSGHERDM